MLGGAVGAGSPGGENLLTVTVARDDQGYGMKVSGDNPVYVQSVKEHGAAWKAGLRAGDRILRVDSVPVHHHTHQQVVQLIRANPSPMLTVQQNSSRHKTPITAPVPVNPEKQRQVEAAKAHTFRLMLDKEQKYIRDLRNELLKVPDVRKQAELEAAEQRCSNLQHRIDDILAQQPEVPQAPPTPKMGRAKEEKTAPQNPTSFLSGLPRSLSNLTGQSLRNLRQARQNKQENAPALVRQNSDESNNKRRHVHNNTVPMVPTTCLDNTPPPLPPRSIERPKRSPLSPNTPPLNPMGIPKPGTSSPAHKYYKGYPMHQSAQASRQDKFRRSSHSLDGELEGPQPNSIAMQMSYPLVNVPPPPLQMDNHSGLPILHVRSQSSPEHLDNELTRSIGERPPGTPPPPYPYQPCPDPQRAIISMEEDDSPASDNSTCSGLFSNMHSVRESKARMAVLINWLLGERRCACASLLLVLTDAYRAAAGVQPHTLRRWAYEIQSTFLMPNAVLQLSGMDENMANEIDHVLRNEHDKEELLRNVFRKARRQAKEELARQLSEFQVKRQVGLATLYGPGDHVLQRCDVDKQQELIVVERLMSGRLSMLASSPPGTQSSSADVSAALLAALTAAALCLGCSEVDAREVRRRWWQSPRTKKKKTKPASVAAAVGGARASFLQRDKLYKQRVKQLAKQHPQPFVVRGHQLQLQALTAVHHCNHCSAVVSGLAPQAYVCSNCDFHVHRACARYVEESCVLDHDHGQNRISRLMERIHPQPGLDSSDKKSRKSSGSNHFLNMERSFRKSEETWEQPSSPLAQERRDESDESLYESADGHSDAISASDDALPRLGKTPTISKESLKLAVTDEEADYPRLKKGHRKTMSLSHPFDIVKSLGDELFDKKDDKNNDKKKSRESLWSEEDSVHGSNAKLDMLRKNSKKDERDGKTNDISKRKSSKGSSVSALNFLRRKKTPTLMKAVESLEVVDGLDCYEIKNRTKLFLEEEKRYCELCQTLPPPATETDTDEEIPAPKIEHRRRLSRQTSRSKSKVRGKSQSVKVHTLRKSHSGTLKKGKKKSVKAPTGRSRQASLVEPSPSAKRKTSDAYKQNSWLFSGTRGEQKREGSTEEPAADADAEPRGDPAPRDPPDKEHDKNWRGVSRGVNRAESCRERDAPRRGKHRNASDPNRLTAHPNHDLEPGAPTAPSGSSSSSSLSSRSNESATVPPYQQGSQSDWSEEEEPLAAQWSDSLPLHVRDTLVLSARLRKRQEVIHELIVSEGSHVRWLKVLGVEFLKPLERQPSLLPAEELRALFPNLPSVRERHSRLYADLRAARSEAPQHVVQIGPVADALLNTLGDSGYAACLSRFCRGQRMALDSLRERRRKSKELQQFLCGREQLPRCGRLQLRDLLACVWQRLTKYQLLLESILKTVCEGGEGVEGAEEGETDSAEEVAQLRKALAVAKEVLHSVDTAIRTAENEHRLRTIQSKLEVRVGTMLDRSEADELRRLDLTQHSLRYEGELLQRIDSKKCSVLALLLEDCLVLLQREGERFLLRPIVTPSAHWPLLPVIKWDKVLFRPNAAVRNTFFLMNINGIQMHELSANTPAEYATWVKHIQESPLARLAESKPVLPHPPTDHRGTNVSRNPSDASEKSAASDRSVEGEGEEKEEEKERQKEDEEENEKGALEEKRASSDREDIENKHRVGCISTHEALSPPPLEPSGAVSVTSPGAVRTAARVLSPAARLRRLDEALGRALSAKSAVAAEMLGVPMDSFDQVVELAVADTMQQVGAGRAVRGAPDLHQLLLVAQAQANQLTEIVSSALTVSEAAAVAARAGRCDLCRHERERVGPTHNDTAKQSDNELETDAVADSSRRSYKPDEFDNSYLEEFPKLPTSQVTPDIANQLSKSELEIDAAADSSRRSFKPDEFDNSYFEEFPKLPNTDVTPEEWCDRTGAGTGERGEEARGETWGDGSAAAGAALLATRLTGTAGALQAALGALLAALPALEAERAALRRELSVARERADRDYHLTTELLARGNMDQAIQDQPSHGG